MGGSRVQVIGREIILPDGQQVRAQAAVDLRGRGRVAEQCLWKGHSCVCKLQNGVIGDGLIAVWISHKVAQVNRFWQDAYSARIKAKPGNLFEPFLRIIFADPSDQTNS